MNGSPRNTSWPFIRLFGCVTLVLCFAELPARDLAWVECKIVYETADGYFVDAGNDAGLRTGSVGTVLRGGARIAEVEVLRTSKSSAFVQTTSGMVGPRRPRAGDAVRFAVGMATETESPEAPASAEVDPTDVGRDGAPDDGFVPLLATPGNRALVRTAPANVFHGRISLDQLFQIGPDSDHDYSISRVRSSGSVERIVGTPWAIEWSGDVSYRFGSGLEDVPDYQDVRVRVFGLSLYRKFTDGSGLRFGRFLPRELPAVGFLDGIQAEKVLGDHVRTGAMAGFKPTRRRLSPSFDEPTIVPYLTAEAGERPGLYYSGTVGLLGSLYQGDPDRLALLFDQRLDVMSGLSFYLTSEVDFDIAMETRSGTQLTHLDLFADYALTRFISLRAGADHYERPDTQAERDELSIDDDRLFGDGYWRYWGGVDLRLPWQLTAYGEVGLVDTPEVGQSVRWYASLTRKGLPILPTGSLSLSVYNLEGAGVEGYAGRITGHFPIVERKLRLDAGVAFRLFDPEAASETFSFTELTTRLAWQISSAWSVYAGSSLGFATGFERYLVTCGVTYRW